MAWTTEQLRHAAKMRCANSGRKIERYNKRLKHARNAEERDAIRGEMLRYLDRLIIDERIAKGSITAWIPAQTAGCTELMPR